MTRYLIDKSVLARMGNERVLRRVGPILERDDAVTCSIVDLEVLYSARNADDHEQIRRRRALAYHRIELDEAIFQRAIAVQGELAKTGRHRVPIPDLVIAAAAESARVTVLHYDHDFDLIAQVTGQPVEWVAERGSL